MPHLIALWVGMWSVTFSGHTDLLSGYFDFCILVYFVVLYVLLVFRPFSTIG